jgi:hypothetical protein
LANEGGQRRAVMNRAYLLLFLALLSVSVSKGQGFDPPPLLSPSLTLTLSPSLLLPYNPIEILILPPQSRIEISNDRVLDF